jgi:hypothetical protein
MIDKNKIYDKLKIRYKTKYSVVCFEGGTATFPPKILGKIFGEISPLHVAEK